MKPSSRAASNSVLNVRLRSSRLILPKRSCSSRSFWLPLCFASLRELSQFVPIHRSCGGIGLPIYDVRLALVPARYRWGLAAQQRSMPPLDRHALQTPDIPATSLNLAG